MYTLYSSLIMHAMEHARMTLCVCKCVIICQYEYIRESKYMSPPPHNVLSHLSAHLPTQCVAWSDVTPERSGLIQIEQVVLCGVARLPSAGLVIVSRLDPNTLKPQLLLHIRSNCVTTNPMRQKHN